MTLDQICAMTTSPTMLNALHACRPGHPLSNKFQWRDAWALALQHREINGVAQAWLLERMVFEACHAA